MVNDILELMDANKFTWLVEKYINTNRVGPIEAIVTVCEKHSVEVTEVNKFLSPTLKSKLEAEAMHLNYLPRRNRLPI